MNYYFLTFKPFFYVKALSFFYVNNIYNFVLYYILNIILYDLNRTSIMAKFTLVLSYILLFTIKPLVTSTTVNKVFMSIGHCKLSRV